MLIMNPIHIRDEKIAQLKSGRSAYAENAELIRLMKRSIERDNIHVLYDQANTGCWFIPMEERQSS